VFIVKVTEIHKRTVGNFMVS